MVKFVIVERTICDAISSAQAGPARSRRRASAERLCLGAKFRKAMPMAMRWLQNLPALGKFRTRRMTSLPIRNSRAVAT